MKKNFMQVIDLNYHSFEDTYAVQRELVVQRLRGDIPDTLILVEHPHTFTIGRSGHREHLLVPPQVLEEEKITVHEIDRGGDITYHGPGQVVAYPILNLREHVADVRLTIHLYEEIIIRVLGDYGVTADRDPCYPGVWVRGAKIAAIGIAIRHWITFHGFAFNINNDLRFFDMIVPCGIHNRTVTSLSRILGDKISLEHIKHKLVYHFSDVFELSPQGADL